MKNHRDEQAPIIEHFEELRKLLFRILIFFLLGTLFVFLVLKKPVFQFITGHIKYSIVFLSPAEPFIVTLKISAFIAVLCLFPLFLFWIIRFFELKTKIMVVLLPLFYVGCIFGFEVFLPIALSFFMGFQSIGVLPMITYNNYINFVLTFVLLFGLVFLLPIIFLYLAQAGVLSSYILRENRRYIIVLIFIIAAIFTPPDVITQLLLALPLIILYELGIMLIARWERKTRAG